MDRVPTISELQRTRASTYLALDHKLSEYIEFKKTRWKNYRKDATTGRTQRIADTKTAIKPVNTPFPSLFPLDLLPPTVLVDDDDDDDGVPGDEVVALAMNMDAAGEVGDIPSSSICTI